MNIDAAFFPNGDGAAGVILRNDRGESVAGGCWALSNLLDATTAEAMALQKALILIEQNGCSPTIIESDCLELCQAYHGLIEVWSPLKGSYGHLEGGE